MTLISIITPAYNCSKTIKETYASIVNQSYSNWEWLITEDFSTDDTFEILLSLAEKDRRVKVFRNIENSGAAVSRNRSISKASGKYLAFIDSDDLWEPNKLSAQIEFMTKNNVEFSFTAYRLVDQFGKLLNKTVDTQQRYSLSYTDMLKKKATLGCSTVMLKVDAFPDISMPLIRTGQDYALWLKLLKNGKRAYPISFPLTSYRILPDSISRNKFKKAARQWEIYREIENLSLHYSALCFCYYAWRAVFRKK